METNDPEGGGRPPGGPLNAEIQRPIRINLNHNTPSCVKPGALFFVTIGCQIRGANQLCRPALAPKLLEAARFYHACGDWFLRLFLLMPDHVHALVAPAPDKSLNRVVGDWKRFASTQHGIAWQKNFIDHRIRSDEGVEEKAAYIRMNPFRAGLIGGGEKWPHVIEHLA